VTDAVMGTSVFDSISAFSP